MVLDTFEYEGSIVEVNLTKIDDTFEIRARWAGGGRVDGFHYNVDIISSANEEEAANFQSIKALAMICKTNVQLGLWNTYNIDNNIT